MTVSRILCASFFAITVAVGTASDVSSAESVPAGAANPDGYYGHCMPQESGDYTPRLMDRLASESGMRVIPLPQGVIAVVPQDCVQTPAPDGVPVSAWNARWDCEYVDVSDGSQYSLDEVRAMEANGYTPAPEDGELLNPVGC